MGWCCRRTYQEMASLLGKILSPHPLLRAWAASALLRACFPGTHKAPSGTGAIYIYIERERECERHVFSPFL